MMTKGLWNHINMPSILMMMMMMFAWTPSFAAPGPAPQSSPSSLSGGATTELPPTGSNLVKAATKGDLDGVKDLLARGAEIEFYNAAPLRLAANNGHLEVVKYLLESGANPNGTTKEGYFNHKGRPLQDAAENNHLEIIDLLLEFGASVKLPVSRFPENVMDKAAKNGHLEAVQRLVKAGADPNHLSGAPLRQAAKNGHLEVVKYLLESGANANGTAESRFRSFMARPLQDAAENNHLEIIDLLLEFGASAKIPQFASSLMDRAAENGHLEAIQRLLKAGAKPDDFIGRTLYLAAKGGYLGIVEAFIEAGANVNNGGGRIITRAAGEGHREVVRALIEAGATNESIRDSMTAAASKGQLEVIKLLLEKGVDPNYGNVLTYAAAFGDVEVVRTLIEAGSQITYNDFYSPLHVAAQTGHPDVIAVLVEYGDDINRALQNDSWWDPYTPFDANYGNGWTVMHAAARFGHPIVQELLELGADINIPDVKGRTPLHVAVFYEKFLVAMELLRFCADLTGVDNEGQTVLDVAKDLSLKNPSDTSKYRIMLSLLKEIIPEKIALTPSTDEAQNALRDEFLALLDTNSTLKERLKDVRVYNWHDHLDSSISYIFTERARTGMANIIEDHNCKAFMEEEQGITIAIGTEYMARCDCVAGQGPKMTLTPREESNLCSPVSPPQEEE